MEEFLASYGEHIAMALSFLFGFFIKDAWRTRIFSVFKYATLIIPLLEKAFKKPESK